MTNKIKLSDIKTEEDVRAYLSTTKSLSAVKRYSSGKFVVDTVNEKTHFLPDNATFKLRVQCYLDGMTEWPKCPICETNDVALWADGLRVQKTCGQKSCAAAMVRQSSVETSRDRYGTDYPMQNDQIKQKSLDGICSNHGGKHFMQTQKYKSMYSKPPTDEVRKNRHEGLKKAYRERGEEILKSQQEGMLRKYGVRHAMHIDGNVERILSKQIAEHGTLYFNTDKAKQDRIRSFGTENFFSTEKFKKEIKAKNLEKYGVEHHLQKPEAFAKLQDREWLKEQISDPTNTVSDISLVLDVNPTTVWRYIRNHDLEGHISCEYGTSSGERELCEFLDTLGVRYDKNVRTIIKPLELDIVLSDYNVAIEYNGVYWHSEIFKERDYHKNKSKMCADKQIQLIHIWEDDWGDDIKRGIIKKKILSKLGKLPRLFARKTTVNDSPVVSNIRELYNTNHIQGFVGATVHISLEYNDETVAAVSFADHGDGVWELTRFASSVQVVGGFSKLLTSFKRTHHPKKIFTFAHCDYSHGKVYESTGFTRVKETVAGMWYVKNGKRFRRERFMKHKLDGILENFDPNLSERENMSNHGFCRLFDAGSIRYEMVCDDDEIR